MPSLHPFIVHFPIALLIVGLLAEGCARLFNSSDLSRTGWWSQLAGTIGLAAAVGSGLIARESALVHDSIVGSALETHEQWALGSMAIFAVLLFWRIAARTQVPSHPRFAYVVLYGIAVAALCLTAWHGGELVYGMGVGVSPR